MKVGDLLLNGFVEATALEAAHGGLLGDLLLAVCETGVASGAPNQRAMKAARTKGVKVLLAMSPERRGALESRWRLGERDDGWSAALGYEVSLIEGLVCDLKVLAPDERRTSLAWAATQTRIWKLTGVWVDEQGEVDRARTQAAAERDPGESPGRRKRAR